MRTRQIQKTLEDEFDEVDVDLQIAKERHAEICHIESTVIQNNDLMLDLSFMVYAQGEKIDSIEANINAANNNTKAGVKSLEKAEDHQRACMIL